MAMHTNKIDAVNELDGLRADLSNKICPLMKTTCDPLCMSRYEGKVVKKANESYTILIPYCSNVMVTGEMS